MTEFQASASSHTRARAEVPSRNTRAPAQGPSPIGPRADPIRLQCHPARTSSSSAAHRKFRQSDRSDTPYILATSRALSLPSVICRRAVVHRATYPSGCEGRSHFVPAGGGLKKTSPLTFALGFLAFSAPGFLWNLAWSPCVTVHGLISVPLDLFCA